MVKFNVLTCDKGTRKDGSTFYKIVGTLNGESVLNDKQIIVFYSNTSVIAGGDYEVILYSTDMQSVKIKLGNQLFKK